MGPLTSERIGAEGTTAEAMNGSGEAGRRGRRRTGGSLDQWMAAGRQLVDGVAGARPGSRSGGRGVAGRGGGPSGLGGLGRWVENRIDWLLEGDDDWPEPWQEPPGRGRREGRDPEPVRWDGRRGAPERDDGREDPWARPAPPPSPPPSPAAAAPDPERPRRALEAISRRSAPLLPAAGPGAAPPSPAASSAPPPPDSGARPLPRSSRRPR